MKIQLQTAVTLSLSCVLVATAASTGQAAILSVKGDATFIVPPPSVAEGALEVNNRPVKLFAFEEQQNLLLNANIGVDITADGIYTGPGVVLSPGSIGAGTLVDSHFLHFDPIDDNLRIQNVKGSVTFDGDILGVMVLSETLDDSDSLFGVSSVFYPTGSEELRGLGFGENARGLIEGIKVVGNNLQFDLRGRTSVDQIRVITATNPVPEPTAVLGLLTFGIFGVSSRLWSQKPQK